MTKTYNDIEAVTRLLEEVSHAIYFANVRLERYYVKRSSRISRRTPHVIVDWFMSQHCLQSAFYVKVLYVCLI